MRLRRAPLALLAACLLGLAACGGGDAGETTAAAPPPTGTTGPTAQADTGPTGTTEAPPQASEPPEATDPATATLVEPTEPEPPGSGDEEPIRQPVAFEIGGEDVKPGSISVAPFLAIELKLENVSSMPLIVRLVGTDTMIEVAAGETTTRRLEGLKAGLYTLSVNDGAQVGTVVVGDDVGP